MGFKAAADGVYDAVTNYLDRRGFDRGRVKLWLCGYSRGGAVTNLLGARFTFESGIGKDNIFAYSFATPVTVFDRACLSQTTYSTSCPKWTSFRACLCATGH